MAIFQDSFTESSNTFLHLHTPDVGTSWSILYQDISNILCNATTDVAETATGLFDDGVFYSANGTYDSENYAVTVTTPLAGGAQVAGILGARVQDVNNLYALQFSANKSGSGSGRFRILKRIGGVWQTPTADVGGFLVNGDTVQLKVQGTSPVEVTAWCNGVLKLTFNDSTSPFTSAGTAGLGLGNFIPSGWTGNSHSFDNFSVVSTVVVEGTGGMTLGGTINPHATYHVTTTGTTLLLAGSGNPDFKQDAGEGTGTLTIGGTTSPKPNYRVVATGGLELDNDPTTATFIQVGTTSGGITIGGEANSIHTIYHGITTTGTTLELSGIALAFKFEDGEIYTAEGTGGLEIGGTTTTQQIYNATATGGLTLAGSAFPELIGTGGLILSGTTTAYVTYYQEAGPSAFGNGFFIRTTLTIPAFAEANLTGFPLPITLYGAPGYYGFANSNNQMLEFEIESFDEDTFENKVWVKTNIVANTPTVLYLFFDRNSPYIHNESATWDAFFKGVYHLTEEADGTNGEYADSTSNNFHGTGGNGDTDSVPDLEEGIHNNGQHLVSEDFIQLPHEDTFPTDQFTISGWIRVNTFFAAHRVLFSRGVRNNNGTQDYSLLLGHTSDGTVWGRAQLDGESDWEEINAIGTTPMELGEWFHLALTWQPGDKLSVYLNGQLEAQTTTDLDVLVGSLAGNQIGAWSSRANLLDTDIDEIRYSKIARSAAWIKAEYDSMFLENVQSEEEDGGFLLGGFTTPHVIYHPNAGIGPVVTIGGTAQQEQQFFATGSGGLVLSGTTTAYPLYKQAATGGLRILNAPYDEAISQGSIAGWWKLDESTGTTAINYGTLGSSVDGTYVNSPTLNSRRVVYTTEGGACALNGTSQYITIPSNSQFNSGTYNAKTILFWFRPEKITGKQMLYCQGTSTKGLCIYLQDATLRGGVWSGATTSFLNAGTVELGKDHQAAMIYVDAANLWALCLDATAVAAAFTPDLNSHNGQITFGANIGSTKYHTGNSTDPDYFKGAIQHVFHGNFLYLDQIPAIWKVGRVQAYQSHNTSISGATMTMTGTITPTKQSHWSTSGAGGLLLSGTATPDARSQAVASGGLTLSGAAEVRQTYTVEVGGVLTLGGSPTTNHTQHATRPTGGLTISGEALSSPVRAGAGTGGLTLGGSVVPIYSPTTAVEGGITLAGTVQPIATYHAVGSGDLTLAGSPTTQFVPHINGSGGLVLGGSPTISRFATMGTGGLTLTASTRPTITYDAGTGSGGLEFVKTIDAELEGSLYIDPLIEGLIEPELILIGSINNESLLDTDDE